MHVALIPESGVQANPETESLLQRSGFEFDDANGPRYYNSRLGHFVYIYADDTWDSDKAGTERLLESYLAWVRSKMGDS